LNGAHGMDLGARLAGRHVLVTGASSGLGRHFAELVAGCGARVTIAARRRDRLEELAGTLRDLGSPEVRAIELDVTDPASVEAALASAGPIDVLVNNAGIAEGRLALDVPSICSTLCWTPTFVACGFCPPALPAPGAMRSRAASS
jgi:NAD(P)-dependent dehydrogenase (short-subunit alcohol dehydrogenase family)